MKIEIIEKSIKLLRAQKEVLEKSNAPNWMVYECNKLIRETEETIDKFAIEVDKENKVRKDQKESMRLQKENDEIKITGISERGEEVILV